MLEGKLTVSRKICFFEPQKQELRAKNQAKLKYKRSYLLQFLE